MVVAAGKTGAIMHELRKLYPPIFVNALSIKPTSVENGNIRQTGFRE
jgi:hypothetical protein